jgi:adenosylhomocysteinase
VGSATIRLDGAERQLTRGQVVTIPPDTRHALLAVSTPPWQPTDHHRTE